MSTYLVAFAVGEFDFSYTPTPTKPEYRVATKPGEKPNTEAAIEFGPAILAYYEDYFNYSFPLPKIDSLATPDFGKLLNERSQPIELKANKSASFVLLQMPA